MFPWSVSQSVYPLNVHRFVFAGSRSPSESNKAAEEIIVRDIEGGVPRHGYANCLGRNQSLCELGDRPDTSHRAELGKRPVGSVQPARRPTRTVRCELRPARAGW